MFRSHSHEIHNAKAIALARVLTTRQTTLGAVPLSITMATRARLTDHRWPKEVCEV